MMEEVYIDNPSIQLLNINGKVDCEPVPTGIDVITRCPWPEGASLWRSLSHMCIEKLKPITSAMEQ